MKENKEKFKQRNYVYLKQPKGVKKTKETKIKSPWFGMKKNEKDDL